MCATRNLLVAALASISLAGCVAPEETVHEGVTLGAGNAIAHNSALQIIDPWPPGVQDTDIDVPADREGGAPAPATETAVESTL